MSVSRDPRLGAMSVGCSAFTLVELLVVIALISGLTALLLGNLSGGGNSTALKTGQAAVAGLFTVARAKAVSSGQPCRLMFNIDATSSAKPARFLRHIVLQSQTGSGWETVTDLYLPVGVYFVPGDFAALPAGLFSEGAASWIRADGSGSALRSTVLRSGQVSSEVINSTVSEQWVSLSISGIGTTAQAGDMMIASGRIRAPGSYTAEASPVELCHRDSVCGLALSSYGLAVLIADISGF